MIHGSSSHLNSAHDNVIKYVGIPNCLTIANTSYKNCFQYDDVTLVELINENALFLAINLSLVPLKLLLTVPTVNVHGLVLRIVKIIDERKWYYSYTDLAKNI